MPAIALLLLLLADPFQDATEAAGLAGVQGDRFTFADLDADGDPDLIVQGQRLFVNDGGRFSERPDALAGARGSFAACGDMDGDGRLDVVTGGGDLFLQAADGTFRRVALDFPERQASVALGDVDGDGRVDILTGGGERWADNRSYLYPRRLLRNEGDGRFTDATERFGLVADSYGRSVVFCDFDDDGDQDVYFGNYRLAANELWRNGPDGLVECAEALGCRGKPHEFEGHGPYFGHTIAASWADLDGDGWLDLWVSNLVHKYVGPWPKSMNHMQGEDVRGKLCDDSNLFRNAGAPSFLFEDRRAAGIAVKPVGGRGVYQGDELWSNCAAADFDLDGDLDVFVTQVYKLPYSHSLLFRNEGGFRFTAIEPGFRVFNGYGAAWADVDGDGRPDLVTGGGAKGPQSARAVRLWRNTTTGGAWIGFRFDPPALGAVVRVVTKRRVHARLAESGMGSHAQANSGILHVGLGDEEIVEVRVAWPGGTEQRLPDATTRGRVHVIRAPKRGQLDVRLSLEENELVVKPAVPGAAYHWDLDDDFRTDRVTTTPRCPLPAAGAESRSVVVRILVGDVGPRARLTIP